MKFLQETTNWSSSTISNHLYVMDDSKDRMIAYRQVGQTEFKIFKKPIRIDLRGRTFTEVKNTFGFVYKEDVPVGKVHKVMGSKGEEYTVLEDGKKFTCTCSGFKFRSKCKHVEQVQNKVAA